MIARLLERETPRVRRLVAALPGVSHAVIAARGSSDHAAAYATYAWGALARLPVALAAPSLYTIYQAPPRLDGALVVGISQSGQSPDIVAVLEEGKRQGRPTLALVNDTTSPLAQMADHVIELHAGEERSVAATKTYTAQLAALALLAATWHGDAGGLAELRRLPDAIAATLSASGEVAGCAARYRALERCLCIGRGYNHATALELALKLKELTYVMAAGYSPADFRHGPIATVDDGLPALMVMPAGAVFADMRALAESLQERGAELLVISDLDPSQLPRDATLLACPSSMPEWLSPVTAIVPGQVLALHLARAKGIDPDQPRGLTKVTRTI